MLSWETIISLKIQLDYAYIFDIRIQNKNINRQLKILKTLKITLIKNKYLNKQPVILPKMGFLGLL